MAFMGNSKCYASIFFDVSETIRSLSDVVIHFLLGRGRHLYTLMASDRGIFI